MTISSTQLNASTPLPTELLATRGSGDSPERIAEMSRGFEAILVRQILESAQKPLLDKSAQANSSSAGIYRDLISNQLAESISQSGCLGLGTTIQKQLEKANHSANQAEPSKVSTPAAS
jgi:Rod binding domain-containing protein